ncbi:MAG TPA: methionine adenosyltransferase [Chloroflexota bacterium]|nr:methionine adenosyltransferase [Chloroflexota bacterium]
MTTSFMGSPQLYFTSESVTEGHPDKICDQISDAVLDAILEQDPYGRVACETAITTGLILIFGEVSTKATVDAARIAREVVSAIGYDRAKYGFDAQTCGVLVSLKEQSPDIAQGVDRALEVSATQSSIEELGAGDQGMMIGFACNETPEYMPLPIALSHRIARRLSEVRRSGRLGYLRPDGKAQVTVEYQFGRPVKVSTVLVSSQHSEDVTHDQLEGDIIDSVITPVIREFNPDLLDGSTQCLVNPTGRFVIGGPMGDAGLTGRKIIVDTYGGMARHGGGAFSGKDPTKVDRSAAYYARYVAKNLVAAGVADRLEVQVAYAIGKARPLSIMVETFGTSEYSDQQILEWIDKVFDFRPSAIIDNLGLRRPIYRETARYGHFGRDDIDAPWEFLDKVDEIRRLVATEPALSA